MRKMLTLLIVVLISGTAMAQHMDISGMVSEYTGAKSCLMCHSAGSNIDVEAHAKDVASSIHFRFKGDVTPPVGKANDVPGFAFINDGDDDLSNDVAITGEWGKANRYCGVPGAIPPSNWIGLMQNPNAPFNANNPVYETGLPGGCARCHVGNGTLTPAQLDDDTAWETVDCLICHAETYQVGGVVLTGNGSRKPIADSTSATGMRFPTLSGTDLSVTSQSIVSSPPTNNCQKCHVFAGGGYTNKRGHDYDGLHGSGITDIHNSSLSCVDCHITKNHKIGMGRPKPAVWPSDLLYDEDNAKIDCGYCHSTEGQAYFTDMTIPVPEHSMWSGETQAKHMDNISCQTCHILNNQGLDMKWFDQIVREKDGNGRFKRWKPKGHKISGTATLDYEWYNGTVYDDVSPRGEKGNGKIQAYRRMEAYVPVDDATGLAIPQKLGIFFNADSLIANLTGMGIAVGDSAALIDKVVRMGAKDAAAKMPAIYGSLVDGDGNYTGTYSYHTDVHQFSVDHGTNAKSEARGCVDCHAEGGGILDWEHLGYDGNPFVMTSVDDGNGSIPNNFSLDQNYPNPFNPVTTIKYSIAARGNVKLTVFNLTGQLIDTIADMEQAPGHYEVSLDCSGYSSGVYFYQLETKGFKATKKFILAK